MISRSIYEILEKTRAHFPCVILSGPRQVGKSTFLRNVYEGKGYDYVSLDDSMERGLAIGDPTTFLSIHKWPLIIDEAQKAPELFPEIEKLINEERSKKGNKAASGMFILSGSTRHTLLEEAEESLAGRVGIINMMPLSISEILNRKNLMFLSDVSKIKNRYCERMSFDNIFDYIVKGQLPQLYDDPDTPRSVFYSSYITTYMQKDLKDLLEVRDELKFINFLKLLASNTGEELTYEIYSKNIGIDSKTVKAWISALYKTGIINIVQPYNENSITKRIVKRPKMYFFDTGLAAYLAGIDSSETLKKSFLKGRFFETFVFNEIEKTFKNEGVDLEFNYYRDNNQNEIDLVYVYKGELIRCEIKSGTNFNVSDVKGFSQLDNSKFIHGKRVLVCTCDKLSALNDGTLLMPVTTI